MMDLQIPQGAPQYFEAPPDMMVLKNPEYADWQIRHAGIVYVPLKGSEPNWFHRWMQRVAFGFRWERRT